ncbi:hypothetical protein, partial [Eisenbergiella tayi]|uniref:hypothetical protein n=1 Tax=Eisenbergiella tayi TaxID=1432052 RepID=UPI002A80DBCD
GYKDSNLEMTESESVALPFGDSPKFRQAFLAACKNRLYMIRSTFASTFFIIFHFFIFLQNTMENPFFYGLFSEGGPPDYRQDRLQGWGNLYTSNIRSP